MLASAKIENNGVTYRGFVKNGSAVYWERGGFDTKAEALAAAKKQIKEHKKNQKNKFV
jgi:hypothetical protein